MNTRKITAIVVGSCLISGAVFAQAPSAGQPPAARMPTPPSVSDLPAANNSTSMPGAQRTYPGANLPGPTSDEEIKSVSIALPDDPLEPYLLTKENGPFMVLAQVFRGPDSERMALALCKELREEFKLPAYILRSKEFPMKSYIRGTPVQAPSETTKSAIKMPEQIRIHDEAAVLVGNEKTLEASEYLLNKVKKLHPKCLDAMPKLWPWRGLARAIRTTNPYVPAQWLYPKTRDRLLVQMNSGLRSIAHCPGHYTLQVAQFTGRSAVDIYGDGKPMFDSIIDPKSSPLKQAHAEAERLADQLARAPEVARLGQPVFVYHDRTSSRVFIGSFNSADDANAAALHQELLMSAVKLASKDDRGRRATDKMIVPASYLTSVDEMKSSLR